MMGEGLRRPVGVAPESSFAYTMVVCDDGACFYYDSSEWIQIAPIPGSLRALQKATESQQGTNIRNGG